MAVYENRAVGKKGLTSKTLRKPNDNSTFLGHSLIFKVKPRTFLRYRYYNILNKIMCNELNVN
jgi:hypothetical protein